jgi:serine/threonine protein kinase
VTFLTQSRAHPRKPPDLLLPLPPTYRLAADDPLQAQVLGVMEAMAAAWHERGEIPSAEGLLDQHPQLKQKPEAAIQVIYEEVRLRRLEGEEVSLPKVYERFPQWRSQLEAVLDCHFYVEPLALPPVYPEVGEVLGDFELLAVLGAGSGGRVYLGTQQGLAERPMVLKMSPCDGQEHLSLARLQHTHIVPLYWAQDFSARNLRVLCMPYLGGAALAQVLARLRERPLAQRTGQDLLTALNQAKAITPVALPTHGPARQLLARETYVRAVCRLGACLADALQYAHERGLVHLDLKPGNVLLAADGQPLLLDFNLARGPLRAGEPAPEWLGGTVGYMSPEQQAALDVVRPRQPVPADVGGQSDVYSLGIVLYEALGGQLPDAAAPAAVALRRLNPQVSVGLSDVIGKCLARELGRRYASAGALADDLRRHLDHRPLACVANRSLAERWRKWRRRAPYALPIAALLLALLGALGSGVFLTATHIERQRQEVQTALDRGQVQTQEHRYEEAIKTLDAGKALCQAGHFTDRSLLSKFDEHLRLAWRGKKAQELHAVADQVRVLYLTDAFRDRTVQALQIVCRKVWDDQALLKDRASAPLEQAVEEDIRRDLLDLAICWVDLRVRPGQDATAELAHREALDMLAEAELLLGPSPVIDQQRQQHARALGRADLASGPAGQTRPGLPAPWERLVLGRSLLRSGQLREAAAELEQVVRQEPDNFWAKFCLGHCAARRRQPETALRWFSECVGKAPESGQVASVRGQAGAAAPRQGLVFHAESYFHRGQAQAALGLPDEAVRDFERALWLDKEEKLQLKLREEAEAIAKRDLAQGADPADVECRLGLLHFARRDWLAARASVERALKQNPAHKGARALRAKLDSET